MFDHDSVQIVLTLFRAPYAELLTIKKEKIKRLKKDNNVKQERHRG